MARGIMILGAPGSGKSTLARYTALQLPAAWIEIDACIWRQDTCLPFSRMYPREEKIARVQAAVDACTYFVMEGSMDSFHDHFDPLFDLAVYLDAPAAVRMRRVDAREKALFGNRVLPDGDMHAAHQQFLQDVLRYDTDGPANRAAHERWLQALTCPILRLSGENTVSENAREIIKFYQSIYP